MSRLKKHVEVAFPSAARTASANSSGFDGEPYDHAILYVDITSYTSGTFTFYLECSPDNGTTWHRLAAGGETAALAAVASTATKMAAPIGKFLRVAAVGATTPIATFSCDLELIREG